MTAINATHGEIVVIIVKPAKERKLEWVVLWDQHHERNFIRDPAHGAGIEANDFGVMSVVGRDGRGVCMINMSYREDRLADEDMRPNCGDEMIVHLLVKVRKGGSVCGSRASYILLEGDRDDSK